MQLRARATLSESGLGLGLPGPWSAFMGAAHILKCVLGIFRVCYGRWEVLLVFSIVLRKCWNWFQEPSSSFEEEQNRADVHVWLVSVISKLLCYSPPSRLINLILCAAFKGWQQMPQELFCPLLWVLFAWFGGRRVPSYCCPPWIIAIPQEQYLLPRRWSLSAGTTLSPLPVLNHLLFTTTWWGQLLRSPFSDDTDIQSWVLY